MKAILDKLLTAADNHGEDDDPDHTVGDLQDLLRRAWDIMSVSQKRQLLNSSEVEDLAMLGARGEFEASDLVDELTTTLSRMEAAVLAAGYIIHEQEGWFSWETEDDASEDFSAREDAVFAAYAHMTEETADGDS